MFLVRYGLLLLAVALLAGCTPKPKSVDVNGKVTLDGAAMANGQLTLDANDGTVPATMTVKDGNFEGKATVGKKTVRISSFKASTEKASGPGAEEQRQENILPAKFNTASTITAEVTASGINPNKFDVTTK